MRKERKLWRRKCLANSKIFKQAVSFNKGFNISHATSQQSTGRLKAARKGKEKQG